MNPFKHTLTLAPMLALILSGTIVHAQDTAPAAQTRVVSMKLRGQAPPTLALKHRLLPDLADQVPGNAAPLYISAGLLHGSTNPPPDVPHGADRQRVADLLEIPMDKFPVEESRDLVNRYRGAIHQCELAAHREFCHWDAPVRQEGFNTLLPWLAELRFDAQLIALEARIHIARSDFDKAVYSLRTGFALVKHLNEDAVLVQGLVANAILHVMAQRVEEFIQAPGAPNLYWPLADLPDPMLEPRKMIQYERSWLYLSYPQLHPQKRLDMTPQQWQALYGDFLRLSNPADKTPFDKIIDALGIVAVHPQAKEYLIAQGMPPGKVDALPVASAVGLYFMGTYEEEFDELFKWHALPYWQAREALNRFDQQRKESKDRNPLLQFLPAIAPVQYRLAAMQRHLALLRTIEALRAHVAAHGKPPANLAELADNPAPIDPVTGQAFTYSATDMNASLHAPPSPNDPRANDARSKHSDIRYEITFIK